MAETAKSLKVFVSYSRTDVEFADQLVLALEDKGFETILDRHDMSGGENWRERLGKLILSADAVTFILSEKSAASEICAWEVEEARRLSKRILPVTPASVANVKPPQALSDLNWIPFYADPAVPGSGFYYGVKRLEEALRVDLDWLRAQTRYSERSVEWTKAAKAEDLLLRGEALREAHAWLGKTPAGSSPPDGVREYLSASADAEQKREAAARLQIEERETAVKLAEAAVLEKQTAVAEKQAAVAAKARTDGRLRMLAVWAIVAGIALLAVAAAGLGLAAKSSVELAEHDSNLLAREAKMLSARGDKVLAMLVALAADPAARKGPFERWFYPKGYPIARDALASAYATNRLTTSVATGEPVTAMTSFADDKRFVTFHEGGSVRVWEAGGATPIQTVKLGFDVNRAIVLKDGNRALVLSKGGEAKLIQLIDGLELQTFADADSQQVTSIAVDTDEKQVLTGGIDGAIELWDIAPAKRISRWDPLDPGENYYGDAAINGLSFSIKSGVFYSVDGNGQVVRWSASATRPEVQKQLGQNFSATSLTFVGDAALGEEALVVGASNGRIYIYQGTDLQSSVDFQIFDAFTGEVRVTDVLISQDGGNAFATSGDGHVVMFRGDGVSSAEFGNSTDITAAARISGGRVAATGSNNGTVRQWSLEGTATKLLELGREGLEASSQIRTPRSIVLSDNGQQALITYFGDQAASVWTRNGSPATVDATAQTMSPDGQFLMRLKAKSDPGAPPSREREVVRLADKKILHTIAGDQNPIGFVSGDRVLLEGPKGELSIWKFGASAPEWTTGEPAERGYGGRFAVSPDGSRVLAAFDGKIKIWKIGQAEPEASLTVESNVTEARFLPDNRRFALGFQTGGVELWSVGSDRPLELFEDTPDEVDQIVFSHDGSMMATTSYGSAVLWRIGQKEQLQVFDVRDIYSMAFGADGKHVIIAGSDGISEWQIEPMALVDADEQVRMACKKLEQLNVDGFDSRDVLKLPILRGRPENPCVAMGITPAKPKTVVMKPAASTGAGSAP